MKLLDYLTPMKTLPNRFSNLAFWRILRIFKDEVVDAFTYVHTWGSDIESEQATQNDTLSTHGTMLNTHENEISSLKTEETSQNKRILSLELAESTSSGKVSDLEESVKTLNTALESVEKEQSTQNTTINSLKSDVSGLTGDIEIIQGDQSTQDTNIEANTTGIADLWKSVGTLNTDLNSLKPLVYDGSFDFKITTYTDKNGTFNQIVDSLYVVQTTSSYLELTTVPFHVVARAYISIFTNSDHTTTANFSIPMSHVVTLNSGKTRILMSPTPFYAPYGVNKLTGLYITYISHV